MTESHPKDVVRRGYDALSSLYRGDDAEPEGYKPWLDDLLRRLSDRAAVLDVGCGCGVPVARTLAKHGYEVTGVDISEAQIERARRLVPGATFIRADALDCTFPDDAFEAIVCLYALIHVPLDEQPLLIQRFATWLKPGGSLLATTGATAWTGTENHWLGGTAPMWWSQADAATYRRWIEESDFVVDREAFIPEGDGGHTLFWAQRVAS